MEEVKAKQPIMLGRKDYLIRSLDPGTGAEHWNVTYSEIVHLDLEQPDPSTSNDVASLDDLGGRLPLHSNWPYCFCWCMSRLQCNGAASS